MYGHSSKDYRVATLLKSYLTTQESPCKVKIDSTILTCLKNKNS